MARGKKKSGSKGKDVTTEQGVTPYKGSRKSFGEFKCPTPDCNRSWSSAHSWAHHGQKCNACFVMVYPHKQYPLQRRRGRSSNENKQHKQELCEKCISLRRLCTQYALHKVDKKEVEKKTVQS